MANNVSTSRHSWHGQRCHIVRMKPSPRTTRATIGDLVCLPHSIVMTLTFVENKKKKRKQVAAELVAATHLLWLSSDIVSDDEDDDDDNVHGDDSFRISPIDHALPSLTLVGTDHGLLPRHLAAIQRTFDNVNTLMIVTTGAAMT
jgi:hypothetical protein